MVKLKWPVVKPTNNSNIQQALFKHKSSGKVIETSNETLAVGTVAGVSYIILYLYIYLTAWYTIKYTNIPGIKNNLVNTMSKSYEYCEKIGSNILILIFLGCFQSLLIRQNFYKKDPKSLSVAVANYIVIICWLLLFYIPSTKYNSDQTNYNHFILPFIIFICVVYSTITIYELYEKFYDKDSLNEIFIITIFVAVCFFILFFILVIYIAIGPDKYPKVSNIIAFFEIICLISFGIFSIFFSFLPPLLDNDDLKCYYNL